MDPCESRGGEIEKRGWREENMSKHKQVDYSVITSIIIGII
jgi:hypothetical protein